MLLRAYTRDWVALFFGFFFPLIFMGLFGILNFGSFGHVGTGIVDNANNADSQTFRSALAKVETLKMTVGTLDDELPLPDANAVVDAWHAKAPSLDARQRLLYGEPWTLARARQVLWGASLRQRHPLALWLHVRSGAGARINTRALAHVQQAQLWGIQELPEDALVRNYEGH